MIKEIYKLAGPPKPAWHAVHQTIKFPALAGYSIIKVIVSWKEKRISPSVRM